MSCPIYLKATIENLMCVQCGQEMKYSYGNDNFIAPFCNNPECPNYSLLQVGGEKEERGVLMNDAQLPVQTDKPQPEWEKDFDLMWGIAPPGTPKYDKGEHIKKFIRSTTVQLLQECKERIENEKTNNYPEYRDKESSFGAWMMITGFEKSLSIISDIQKEHGL